MKKLFMPLAIKLSLCLSLLGFMSANVLAQDKELEPVDIPLIGLSQTHAEITYTHEKVKDGRGRKGKITASLEILSETDDGYIAAWTSKSMQFGDIRIDENSPQAASLFLGVPIEFLMSSDGGPIKLSDKDKLLSGLSTSAAFADTDPAILKKTIDLFSTMDDSAIANMFLKVPSFMSVCQHTSFALGEANEYTSEYPSPFGEGVIMSNINYQLTSINSANTIATIKYTSEFDQGSVMELLTTMFKKMSPDTPPSQDEIDELSINRVDSANCKVDMKTGWVSAMKYSTVIEASGEVNEENFDISLDWRD